MRLLSGLILSVLLFSCGKVFQKNEDEKTERRREDINDNVTVFLRSQKAKCSSLRDCNPSIGKLTIWNKNLPTNCTGALISNQLFLTSASCLPRNMRIAGIGCSGKAVVSFAQSSFYKQENAYCSRIEFSDTLEMNKDPALTRTDFAIIRLESPVNRPIAKISRSGLSDKRSYYTWSSSVDSSTSSTIVKKKCRPVYDSFANPFGSQDISPSMIVKDCVFDQGSSGSVIVNNKQNIVGLVNSALSADLVNFLKDTQLYTESLENLSHVSNAFCLSYKVQEGEDYQKECLKRISIYGLDKMRSAMLHSRKNHVKLMRKYEKKIEQSDKYFNWDVEFLSEKNMGIFEIQMVKPKCFTNVKKWIREFKKGRKYEKYGSIRHKISNIKIFSKLDSSLKSYSFAQEDGVKEYKFSFSPRNLYFNDHSYVRMIEVGVLAPTSILYDDIKDECVN